jgi:hypothetical protein
MDLSEEEKKLEGKGDTGFCPFSHYDLDYTK